MSLKLYMDEHVPSAITRGLREREIDVLTAQEDGQEGTEDPFLLNRANELGRILFTQDEDFLKEASERQNRGEKFLGIIYAHQRVPIRDCIEDLSLILLVCESQELANQLQYLPLKKPN